ncbi:MAG: DNA translocase FtsK 4TM domain-containing protein, partial [Planctomycetota bacterium]
MKRDAASCGSMASPYGSRAVGLTRSAVLPTVALLACVFLWPALLTFHVGDWPSPNQHPHNDPAANACGLVGAWCAYHLRHVFGDGTYLLLLFATLAALLKVVRGEIGSIWERVFGLGLVVACTSASAHLICGPGPRSMPVGHGGLVGYALGDLLTGNLSRVGTIIVLTSSWVVGLIFATQGWILKIPSMMGRAAQASSGAVAAVREFASAATARHLATATQAVAVKPRLSASPPYERPTVDESEDAANVVSPRSSPPPPPKEVGHPPATVATPEKKPVAAVVAAPKPVKVFTGAGPIVRFPSAQQTALAEPYPRQIENWRLPSVTLLHEPEYGFDRQQEQFVRKQAKVLEETLEEFRIDAQVVEIDTGPVITMFELRLGAGIKVSQIATLSNDIARALKAHAIRVVAPI